MTLGKKILMVSCCALLACAALAGCMSAGDRPLGGAATDAPQSTAGPTEGASVMPIATSALQSAFDWLTGGRQVEEKINLLSEIEESRVVTTGNTALVGVTFASQYQGGMTQRIHNLVAGVVQEADPSIQTVAVTSEKEDVEKINAIAGQLEGGTPASELETQIDTIARNVTTMQ